MADSLNQVDISDRQAVAFARSFYLAVAQFVATHEKEYQEWLNQKETENDK